jgi:hypothetical protein
LAKMRRGHWGERLTPAEMEKCPWPKPRVAATIESGMTAANQLRCSRDSARSSANQLPTGILLRSSPWRSRTPSHMPTDKHCFMKKTKNGRYTVQAKGSLAARKCGLQQPGRSDRQRQRIEPERSLRRREGRQRRIRRLDKWRPGNERSAVRI